MVIQIFITFWLKLFSGSSDSKYKYLKDAGIIVLDRIDNVIIIAIPKNNNKVASLLYNSE